MQIKSRQLVPFVPLKIHQEYLSEYFLVVALKINHKVIFDYLFKSSYMPV